MLKALGQKSRDLTSFDSAPERLCDLICSLPACCLFQNSGELLNLLISRFHPDSLNWELQKLDLKPGMYRCLCVLVCICGTHWCYSPTISCSVHSWEPGQVVFCGSLVVGWGCGTSSSPWVVSGRGQGLLLAGALNGQSETVPVSLFLLALW